MTRTPTFRRDPTYCEPPIGTAAGTQHVLSDRHSGGEKVFEWTGNAWSTPGTGWGTKASLMGTLGWRWMRPAT